MQKPYLVCKICKVRKILVLYFVDDNVLFEHECMPLRCRRSFCQRLVKLLNYDHSSKDIQESCNWSCVR
jgi:hypothetical protein